MATFNGPVSSSDLSFGDLTSDTSGFLLSTKGATIRISTLHTPTSSADAGYSGEIRWDASYIYIYTGAAWRRIAHAAF